MTVQELPPVPALPDRARPLRWGYFSARLLLVVVLVALAGLLPSGRGSPDRYRYREGDIARERVVSPYEFRVEKDEPTLRREQVQAAGAVPPVFVLDPRVAADGSNSFSTFQGRVLAIVQNPTLQPGERTAGIKRLGVPLSDESLEAIAAPGRAR